jgi:hypothetical protein
VRNLPVAAQFTPTKFCCTSFAPNLTPVCERSVLTYSHHYDVFMWSDNHKFYIQFSRLLRLQSFRITLYNLLFFPRSIFYPIFFNNRLYTPPNEGINGPLWPGFVKNLPSNGRFNYSNNGIKHYLIKENHRLCTQ